MHTDEWTPTIGTVQYRRRNAFAPLTDANDQKEIEHTQHQIIVLNIEMDRWLFEIFERGIDLFIRHADRIRAEQNANEKFDMQPQQQRQPKCVWSRHGSIR